LARVSLILAKLGSFVDLKNVTETVVQFCTNIFVTKTVKHIDASKCHLSD
jgi:hypothetical protein